MTLEPIDLDALPLRFTPPDGWRTPHPRWIDLHQGVIPPENWEPYPGAPPVPEFWPWWEENGTAWFSFFRNRAPAPARAMGHWFSLAALGLFTLVVSPFALSGWWIPAGGVAGVAFLALGVPGVIRTYRRGSAPHADPLALIADWASLRREAFFSREFQRRIRREPGLDRRELESSLATVWWGESGEAAENY